MFPLARCAGWLTVEGVGHYCKANESYCYEHQCNYEYHLIVTSRLL
jgi:hypothetical protein